MTKDSQRAALENWLCAVLDEYDDLGDIKNTDRGADASYLASALLRTNEGATLAQALADDPSWELRETGVVE